MTPLPLIITLLLLLFGASPASAAESWTWPVRGEVLTAYVNGDDPYAAGQHRGIDVAAPQGHPVVAAVGGTVTFVGSAGSSGLTVAIRTDDGRLDTSYLHLSAIEVGRGDVVDAGDHLGAVGVSGRRSADAPHLHFGVREAGSDHGYLNPLDFLPPLVPPPAAPEPRPVPVGVPVPAEPVPESVPVRVAPEPLPAPAPGLLPLPLPMPLARAVPVPGATPVPEPLPLLGFEPAAAPRVAPELLPTPHQTAGHSTPAEAVAEPGPRPAPSGAPSASAEPASAPNARLTASSREDASAASRADTAPSSARTPDALNTPSRDGSGHRRSRLTGAEGGRVGPREIGEPEPPAPGDVSGRPEIRFAEDRPAAVRQGSGSPFDLGRVAAVVALLVAAVAVARPGSRRSRRPRRGADPRPLARPLAGRR